MKTEAADCQIGEGQWGRVTGGRSATDYIAPMNRNKT